MHLSDKDKQKFWSLVSDQTPTGCRLWLGGYFKSGHARFYYQHTSLMARRVAYELALGVELPKEVWLIPTCHSKQCVTWEHMQPEDRSGAYRKLIEVGLRPGIPSDIKELILMMHDGGLTHALIAAAVGYSETAIHRLLKANGRGQYKYLTPVEIAQIQHLRAQGWTYAALQERFNRSDNTINKYCPVKLKRVTHDEITKMRELRAKGLSYEAIGTAVGRNHDTAWKYSKDVAVNKQKRAAKPGARNPEAPGCTG